MSCLFLISITGACLAFCLLFFVLSATEAKALIQSWKRLREGDNDSKTAEGAEWTADKETLERMKRCPWAQRNAHRLNQVKTKALDSRFICPQL